MKEILIIFGPSIFCLIYCFFTRIKDDKNF